MASNKDTRFDSDSDDGEDFNPEPGQGSDDERAGAGSDAEVAVKPRSKTTSRKPTPPSRDEGNEERNGVDRDEDDEDGRDDEDKDDNDEGDDDDDDDDDVAARPRKRARRDPRNQFIDIEAEVDDEDEGDDDDEEEGAADFIAKDHPDDVDELQPGTEHDDRRHRELDRKRELEQQMDAEKQAALLKERYGRRQVAAQQVSQVPRRLLLPSVEDPSIWGVRCKPGKEREVVFSILKRWEERLGSKNPLPIFSAFERGSTSMAGYVYVEARKQSDILGALDGILFCYPRTKMVLVAIKEMPDLLRVQQSEQLQPGGYVRIKNGKYKGDLAQIDDVESNGLEVSLRIVPRLDYGLNEDANGDLGPDGKRKRGFAKSEPVPPQRLFSEAEARKRHAKNLQAMSTFDKKQWQYLNETYVNGYLIKDFKIQQLVTKNVNPTLEEVSRFAAGSEDGTENLDLTALAASLKNNTATDSYLPGDTVEIYEGEQSGITGKAIAVRGDIVTIRVTEGDIRGQTIDVPMKGLRKRFRAGDHVKIIGGSRFRDEVGMVVSLKGDQVTMVSDLTMQEITVFGKDLREATDTGAAGGLGRYDIHDLVQLDPATVGCVTKVDRESLRVLDQNGTVRTVMPSQISNKIEKRRHAVATDRNGAEIRQDDTVKEVGGEAKQGVIVHVHRSYLFCHNREQTDNSGVFVVRATNVATVAAKGGRVASQTQTGPDLNRMNPAMQRNGANGGAMPPPPAKAGGRDRALGQTVTVRKGPYKGLLGIVKDTTDTEARVELHTKAKTVGIPKDFLGFKDPISGNSMTYSDFAGRGRGRGGGSGAGTPSSAGFSGGWGGATPRGGSDWGAGSRTPQAAGGGGHGSSGLPVSGSRTPAWGGSSSRTPAWGGGTTSSARTPGWTGGGGGASSGSFTGSRTPAWNADGNRTAYGGGGGSGGGGFGSGGGGSRTPAWGDAGSRTPAYASSFGGSRDAPTPAASGGAGDAWARDAPTPSGGAGNAPTPGAWGRDAPTPSGGAWKDAPTPAGGAPTPFAGGPETPAAWGADDEDEGPRYVEDE